MCTFVECENSEKLYVTRSDWIYHESQMHRRQWVCAGNCGEIRSTKDSMATHFRCSHSDSISESQIPIFLDICERPVELCETTACPLCLEDLSLLRLQTHIAEHMEEIALFVLPNDLEDDGDTDSNKVVGLLSKAAENTSQNASSRTSPTFSPAKDNDRSGQISEAFARLQSVEELSGTAKCASWSLDAHDEDSAMSLGLKHAENISDNTGLTEVRSMAPLLRLETDHPDIRRTPEQLKVAEELEVQEIEMSKEGLGPEHPDTLSSIYSLGVIYQDQGRLQKAEEQFLQVWEIQKRVLGLEHPETQKSWRKLCFVRFTRRRAKFRR